MSENSFEEHITETIKWYEMRKCEAKLTDYFNEWYDRILLGLGNEYYCAFSHSWLEYKHI